MEALGGPCFNGSGAEFECGNGERRVDWGMGAEDRGQALADDVPVNGIRNRIEAGTELSGPIGTSHGRPLLERGSETAGDVKGDRAVGEEEKFERALGIGRIPAHGQDKREDLEGGHIVRQFSGADSGKAETPQGFIKNDMRRDNDGIGVRSG